MRLHQELMYGRVNLMYGMACKRVDFAIAAFSLPLPLQTIRDGLESTVCVPLRVAHNAHSFGVVDLGGQIRLTSGRKATRNEIGLPPWVIRQAS